MLLGDHRARDTGVTPTLGRGFSLATNTYQSTCLRDVRISEPSYDFSYELVEINQHSLDKSKTTSTSLIKSLWGDIASARAQPGPQRGKEVQTERSKMFLGVSLKVDTYYSAVDEAVTPLSGAASALLKREDMPSFFSACGTYYVRGINRHAEFNALLELEQSSETSRSELKEAVNNVIFSAADLPASEANPTCRLTVAEHKLPENSSERDWTRAGKVAVFEPGTYARTEVQNRLGCDNCISQLKLEGPRGCKVTLFNDPEPFVRSAGSNSSENWSYVIEGPGLYYMWPTRTGLPDKVVNDTISSFLVSSPPVSKTKKFRSSKDIVNNTSMRIYARGEGLGHAGDSQLISFSIPEFRQALKDAFLSMQTISTGRVTSVEVVPWTENLGFQSLLQIQDDSPGGAEPKMPLFRKKDILIANGEYLATLHRSLAHRKARYFLARSCEADVQSKDWPDWAILRNHFSSGPGRTVGAMRKILNRRTIDRVLKRKGYFDFLELYQKCVDKILSGDRNAVAKLENSDRIATRAARQKAKETGVSVEQRRMERGKALYLFRYTGYPECAKLEVAMPPFPGYDSIRTNCSPELWGHPTDLDEELLEIDEYERAYQSQLRRRTNISERRSGKSK